MYDPSIHKIEVLKLEKRLDDELLYLRDALPEYSTFDPNMETEILPEGTVYLIRNNFETNSSSSILLLKSSYKTCFTLFNNLLF